MKARGRTSTACICGLSIARWRLACVEGAVVLRITHDDTVCEMPLRGHEAGVVLQRLGLLAPPSHA